MYFTIFKPYRRPSSDVESDENSSDSDNGSGTELASAIKEVFFRK